MPRTAPIIHVCARIVWCHFVLLCAAFPAFAQEFPNKPIRLVVPWPPGGNVDITARTLAPTMSEVLGQQVVVENRAGAGGTIGTTAVVKSPADGYTLLMGSSGTVTVAPTVYKNIAYDPIRDLTTIAPVHIVPMVVVAAVKTPAADFQELRALAARQRLSMASAGNGSSNHLAIELLVKLSGMPLVHVPYRGSGPALNDILGGQVDTMMDQLNASIAHIREGRLKPLAVTTLRRSPLLPTVPTLDEAGVKGFEASTFTGVFGPAGLSTQITARLAAAVRKTLASEPVRERYRQMGVEVQDASPEAFAAYVKSDFEKWRAIAREQNIVVE